MDFHTYKVTLKHDRGKVVIKVVASSWDKAATLACSAEGAPDSAVQKITKE